MMPSEWQHVAYDAGWQHGISYATYLTEQWAESEGLPAEQLAELMARFRDDTTTPDRREPHADGAETLTSGMEIDL
jgi:hypothetical protein